MLKLIGIFSMFLDHLNRVVFDDRFIELWWFGRLALPIFCFYLARGFFVTRDIKNYAARLGFFAVVSQPIFQLVLDLHYLNVLFTLFFCLLFIHFLSIRSYFLLVPLFFLVLISDGGFIALPLVLCFYFIFSRFGVPVFGSSLKMGRYFFYLFYPFHLLILASIGMLVI